MEYLELKEYQNIAKKILKTSFPVIFNSIVQDDDKFGEVVNAVMTADWKWDGRGTIYGYRKQRVQWTVYKLLSQPKPTLSLNSTWYNQELIDTIPDKMSFDLVEYADYKGFLADKIENAKVLSTKEKTYMNQYFCDNLDLKDIASNIGVNRESVKSCIRSGLTKLGLANGAL